MSLVFYCRVSTKEQNLARQLARAKEVKADKVFTDKLSGKNMNRAQFKACMNYLRENDTLEIISLDRISRNYDDIQKIVNELKKKNVRLIVDDLPQTNTGNKLVDKFMLDMMINLMGFVADNERQKILERTKQGIAEAKKRGAYKGKQYEYSATARNRGKRAIFNDIKNAYESNNYSVSGLAKKHDIPRSTVYRILKQIKESEVEA